VFLVELWYVVHSWYYETHMGSYLTPLVLSGL